MDQTNWAPWATIIASFITSACNIFISVLSRNTAKDESPHTKDDTKSSAVDDKRKSNLRQLARVATLFAFFCVALSFYWWHSSNPKRCADMYCKLTNRVLARGLRTATRNLALHPTGDLQRWGIDVASNVFDLATEYKKKMDFSTELYGNIDTSSQQKFATDNCKILMSKVIDPLRLDKYTDPQLLQNNVSDEIDKVVEQLEKKG